MTTFARKNFMSNTSKIEVARTSLICTYYLAMQKIVCHSYLFHNCAKRVLLEQEENVFRTLPFNQQDLIKLSIHLSIHESIHCQSIIPADGLCYKWSY